MEKNIQEKIYAGVLGKIIGVYLGRPVEGWSYDDIQKRFGEISYYVHDELDYPLIIADDDISGTFGFFKALEDYNFNPKITSKEFGKTWQNYVIENKTILWWGGLGRSTEHTAFMNLKNGIEGPQSGSIVQNGKTLSEQIGAQIFIDAFAMAAPNDPELAVHLAREHARVSHDGLAVDAAAHLAAMESLAFGEKNIDKILDEAFKYTSDPLLQSIIHDVRNITQKEEDYRVVRAYLDSIYGYHIYPGACHMVPNHAMVLASILLGKDNFQKSIVIATNSAWDTDCNAANVGAFNGIRLGLDGINKHADFRSKMADRILISTAEGGTGISDAVRESNKIWYASQRLKGLEASPENKQFTFNCNGSTQGFLKDKYLPSVDCIISNANEDEQFDSLKITCLKLGEGTKVNVSAPTFIDFNEQSTLYKAYASPLLYSGQKVRAKMRAESDVGCRLYVLYYDIADNVQVSYSDYMALNTEWKIIEWDTPDTNGMAIFKIGVEITSDNQFNGSVFLQEIFWNNAPKYYHLEGMLMNSIWDTNPHWSQSFVSSAQHFACDFNKTFCVSHPENEGLATIGTSDWSDYEVTSKLSFSLHHAGGLVVRSKGHRRYYGATLSEFNKLSIYCRIDDELIELASTDFEYVEDQAYELTFSVKGNQLTVSIDDEVYLTVKDSKLKSGAAGYVISKGTFMADKFSVKAI